MRGGGATAADQDKGVGRALGVPGRGGIRLFRNLGNGTFAEVTAKAGVANGGFSTSAMFFDYDRDGWLDLLVANYVDWSIEKDQQVQPRSEEHTSELQSHLNLVCRLLLEKKKTKRRSRVAR